MEITIRSIGSSKGVVLPKPQLAQAGLEGETHADITAEGGAIVLRAPAKPLRAGCSHAAQAVAAQAKEALLMGEFGNADDAEPNG